MTGAHAAGPTPERPQRPRRSLGWRVGTPLVGLVSGALFMISAADSGGTDLRPGRYTDLAGLVEAEADDYEELRADLSDLEAEVDALTENVRSLPVSRARGRIEELRDPAGLEPRSGPGVSITMSDSPITDPDEDALADLGIEINQLVVHQQDLQAVVNALWRGGATAVTIAGQRVISTTGIKCEGPTVQLQGVPYQQPYVIEAVGDPDRLVGEIDADPLVSGYRTDAANPNIDIGWGLTVEDHVEAPPYDGILDFRYAEPIR
ncbi:DUF881 domain-containing protein [Nocardioides sp. TF02-7]|uniref:DUF881 domain-containing protein n=1 Tax=Nocardioides sp. TF02-7 TaxID=2917724 RepID=UPI001F064B0B|nr:DUF881 domain-containing protein [Nocardioides sp. TF02-7]UMG94171.1 DUF881 domain-containing protein [Nocardioides sp. TF02-7]